MVSEERMKTEATHKVVAAGGKMMVLQSSVGVRSIVTSLVAFFILASSIVFLFDRGQEEQVQMAVENGRQEVQVKVEAGLQEPAMRGTTEAEDTSKEDCNWSRGRWVYDNASRPLYSGLKCSFIFPEVACDKYGRKDVMYQHWRWQPHGCDLPRFDAIKLLENLRNKRLVFAGEMEMIDGFEIALKKLTGWLGENIDKNKTRIFFAGSSATHSWASKWGGEDSNKCLNETEPIYKVGYKATDYSLMAKAKSYFKTLEPKGIHVQILNITELSDYRKDGHPSVFRKQFVPLTKEQIANPASYADCIHWCLPGVPDVWNEFYTATSCTNDTRWQIYSV